MNPQIEYAAHRSHLADVRRDARRARRARRPIRGRLTSDHEIAVRSAGPADTPALTLLAALDSGHVPHGHVLLGSVDGEVRAAVQVEDGAAVADPFVPTVELVSLLRARAKRLRTATFPAATSPGWLGSALRTIRTGKRRAHE